MRPDVNEIYLRAVASMKIRPVINVWPSCVMEQLPSRSIIDEYTFSYHGGGLVESLRTNKVQGMQRYCPPQKESLPTMRDESKRIWT
jgi:hypothetical protein